MNKYWAFYIPHNFIITTKGWLTGRSPRQLFPFIQGPSMRNKASELENLVTGTV